MTRTYSEQKGKFRKGPTTTRYWVLSWWDRLDTGYRLSLEVALLGDTDITFSGEDIRGLVFLATPFGGGGGGL